MRRPALVILALPLALVGALLAAAPAQAASQPLFGTTVDVTLQPSNDSLLGGTAYALSSGGGVQVTLGAALAADVDRLLHALETRVPSRDFLAVGDAVIRIEQYLRAR